QDESFVYQNNQWSRSLSSDQLTLNLDPYSFGWWVNDFLKTPPPPLKNSQFGATQRAILDEFYTYMWGYWSWAQASTNNPTAWVGQSDSPAVQNPFFRVVIDSQVEIETFTGNLIK